MIVKIEGPIATFAKWKAMVQSNSEKIKKYGMTFLYAGTEKENDSKNATAEVLLLGVRPGFRGHGISKLLLRAVDDVCINSKESANLTTSTS